ncbi:MAG: efflux RND transporter periplasmic adaptor subunit [Chitinophagaceae bacterium]|nr:efflux RND transporter periplasmic adaptor subunit [Chitinophagaceae bacterium]
MKWFFSVFAIVFIACNRKEENLIKPAVRNITESVYASGIVKSRNQYQVFSTVNGIISQKLVSEGDIVKQGDVLMVLANETPKLNTENARIAATYSSVAFGSDRLNEYRINSDLARKKMQNDSALFQRQQHLWNEGIGTRNELEQRELAWKNSQTAYQASVLQYNNLVRQIDCAAQQSLKNLQISNSVNNDYVIKARQNGRVYNILKEQGEMVNTQAPVAVIGDQDEFLMELQVDEYDIGKIRPGQKVFVSLDSYQGQVFDAVVTKIQPIMDDRSRKFKVEASFTSRPQQLFPNLTVEANILISTKEKALIIPRSFLIDDNTVLLKNGETRKVTTGLKDYQQVEIIDGLSKDDLIKKPSR